jgi:hypothetical protein
MAILESLVNRIRKPNFENQFKTHYAMYQALKKILPDNIKNGLWRMTIKVIRKKLRDVDNRIPKYTLKEKHINSLKVITDRQKLLELMPKNGIVAELGVNKGDFSAQILETCQPKRLHLVDIWNTKRYHPGLKLDIEKRFEKAIIEGQLVVNYGLSTDVVKQFEDNYFDWIYIDTEHSYKCTIAELESYAKKMKPGGIIAGHDYVMGSWVNLVRYGVIEAVSEFCLKNNWEVIYLTMDYTEPPSFAIKKLS